MATGNKIGVRGVSALCDALKNNTTLTALDIGGEVPWWYVSVRVIGKSCSGCFAKHTGNKFKGKCAKTVGEVLKRNRTLKALFVEGLLFCGIIWLWTQLTSD